MKCKIEAKSPRTNLPYTRYNTKSITFYLKNNGNITFNPGNIPKNHTIIRSENIVGIPPADTNVGTNWSKSGYYIIEFPNGI